MSRETPGERLREARILRMVSIRAAAKATGLSVVEYSRVEMGRTPPPGDPALPTADELRQKVEAMREPVTTKEQLAESRARLSTLLKTVGDC